MNTGENIFRGAVLALAVAAAATATSCENTDPLAQSDWTMQLTANPVQLTLSTGQSGQSVITVFLFDKNNVPQSGVAVRFLTDVGSLASGGQPVTTNTQGLATDVLTTSATATVAASSGNLSKTAVVTVRANNPVANIVITPDATAAPGEQVTFDGQTSTSPFGTITDYEWTFTSDNPESDWGSPHVEHGAVIDRVFQNSQLLSVTLKVTDSFNTTNSKTEAYSISF